MHGGRPVHTLTHACTPPPPTPVIFVFSQLATRWGEIVPLALALVGAVAAAGGKGSHPFGESLPFSVERYTWIERVLCDTDTVVERPPSPPLAVAAKGTVPPAASDAAGGGEGLRRVIKLAFDTLLGGTTKECFVRLGVLAEGAVAPSEMLSNLWDQVR